MSGVDEDAVVRRDCTIVLANGAVAAMLSTVGVSPDWPVVAAVATALTFLLAAASDRSRAGLWTLVGVGSLAILALGVSAVTGTVATGVMPPAVAGLALGSGLNRLLFGVVTPLPDYRLQRERAD